MQSLHWHFRTLYRKRGNYLDFILSYLFYFVKSNLSILRLVNFFFRNLLHFVLKELADFFFRLKVCNDFLNFIKIFIADIDILLKRIRLNGFIQQIFNVHTGYWSAIHKKQQEVVAEFIRKLAADILFTVTLIVRREHDIVKNIGII